MSTLWGYLSKDSNSIKMERIHYYVCYLLQYMGLYHEIYFLVFLTVHFYSQSSFIFQGSIEFIGRALAKPVVKGAEEPYERPFFPPVLQWFPIYRGDTKAGELLAAFEMFHVSFTDFCDF